MIITIIFDNLCTDFTAVVDKVTPCDVTVSQLVDVIV